MFYYKQDENSNILYVSNSMPVQGEQPPEEWETELATWVELPISDYSPVWDEAKRCIYAKDGLPRYRISNGIITPNANVQDIDFDQGLFEIEQNGILKWK